MRRSSSLLQVRDGANDESRMSAALWKQHVSGIHSRYGNLSPKMPRTRSETQLIMPKIEQLPGDFRPERLWQYGMSQHYSPPSLQPMFTRDNRLPAIRPVDKYSLLAIRHAQAEQQARRTPVGMHAPPTVLAADVHAKQREERKHRWLQKMDAKRAARAAAGEDAAGVEAAERASSMAAAAAAQEVTKKRQALKKSKFVMQANDAINNKFKDMFKAFQYMDLDRSGTLNEKELARALDLLNVPIDRSKLRELIAACDADGDGGISYQEFVDVLARDTVTLAAMGKRGMQAMDAMGDDGMGIRGAVKNVKATLNESFDAVMEGGAATKAVSQRDRLAFVKQAQDAINAKFSNMRKAFQDIDLDRSGTLDARELWHAFDRFNLPLDRARFQALIDSCDKDGDGGISYDEFVDVLAVRIQDARDASA